MDGMRPEMTYIPPLESPETDTVSLPYCTEKPVMSPFW